jgi:serine/threonine-protein kinase
MPTDLLEQLQSTLGPALRIERELSGGGMSRVFLAVDTALGRRVVVKLLPRELGDSVGADRFRLEIQIAANLQHPHIVPLLSAGETEHGVYYTAPYVAGESLRARLTTEPAIPTQEAVRLAKEIALALDYAHREGVIHRDVKPENILLSDNHALLTDFGIAKAISQSSKSLTSTGLSLGTPAYVAPEQAAGDQIDNRADVYALGCVLFEMLAGQPPYSGPTVQSIIAQHVAAPIPSVVAFRPSVPASIAEAITRAMAKNPADRFASAAEFIAAVDNPAIGSRLTFRRVAIPVTVVLALGLAGIATAWIQSRSRPSLDVRRVLVVPFENATGDSAINALGMMSADWVRRGLVESSLADAAEMPSPAPGQSALATARTAHAGLLISGMVYRRGDTLELSARISDVNEGRVVRQAPPAQALVSRPMDGLATVRQRVLAELATIINPRFSEVARVAAHPPSFDAYREIVEGDELAGRGDAANALVHYRQALALDSSFGGAIVRTGTMLAILGRCDQADSLVRAISQRGITLGQLERLQIRRQSAYCNNDYEGTYATAREITRLAPLSEDAWMRLGYSAKYLDRYEEAARILDSLARRPSGLRDERAYGDLAMSLHMLGQYDRELQVVDNRSRVHGTDIVWISEGKVRALAALGRFAQLDSVVNELQGGKLDAEHLYYLAVAAGELLAHGHRDRSVKIWDNIVRLLDAAPDSVRDKAGVLEISLYNLARYADFDTVHRRSIKLSPIITKADSVYLFSWEGLVAARLRRREVAELAMNRLAKLRGRELGGSPTRCRAEIAAVLGDRELAVTLLKQAFSEGMLSPRWETHTDADFAGLKGYPPFEALMKPPG